MTIEPWQDRPLVSVYSDRGYPLVLSANYAYTPLRVLTVELAREWESLYLCTWNQEQAIVERVPFSGRVPNPRDVGRLAEQKCYSIDLLARELIVGRWQRLCAC